MRHAALPSDDATLRTRDSFAPAKICALGATRIGLSNFRSYGRAELCVDALPVVLAGANGIGKTNLLEALSLLSPGRGLRAAKLAAVQRKAPADASRDAGDAFADGLWAVAATITRFPNGSWDIGTGLLPSAAGAVSRRALHLNGAAADPADLAELLPMLWLTPAMDRLFLEGAQLRRRFLDRLVFALDPGHARHAARYERAMSERLRVLRTKPHDRAWIDGLEATMAEEGAAIATARLGVIERLNTELHARRAEDAFPCAHLSLRDGMGEWASERGRLQSAFAASRERDAEAGRTLAGPHLADLEVRHTLKRTDARDCSTGEQKALLISIVLANAWLQKKRHGVAPVLLLDEIAAHLDAGRRAALFEEILALKSQAWLTGTDRKLFAPLAPHAVFVAIENGRLAVS